MDHIKGIGLWRERERERAGLRSREFVVSFSASVVLSITVCLTRCDTSAVQFGPRQSCAPYLDIFDHQPVGRWFLFHVGNPSAPTHPYIKDKSS